MLVVKKLEEKIEIIRDLMNIIWLGISLRDYAGKYKDMNYFLVDLVEKIENHKIESLAKNQEFLVEIRFPC
jgi:hypothetical protein